MRRIIQISSISFIFFYIVSALLHPSFSPNQNFFCDLFNQGTTSSQLAIAALVSVSILIASFFIWFPNQTSWSIPKQFITKIGGSVSAILTCLIFTDYHDELILIASLIGIIPVTLVSLEMIKNWKTYSPVLGFLTFGFLAFYNIVFYMGNFESNWPIMQKISILLCLLWVNIITLKPNSSTEP